jgi:anti-sigma B factor antagonist
MLDTALPFSCAVVPRRDAVHLIPSGELDMCTVEEVDARLVELHLAGFDNIVVDLRGLTFFDSCGVNLLVQWTRRAAAERFDFAVVDGNDIVRRVLALTGVEPHLRFVAGG